MISKVLSAISPSIKSAHLLFLIVQNPSPWTSFRSDGLTCSKWSLSADLAEPMLSHRDFPEFIFTNFPSTRMRIDGRGSSYFSGNDPLKLDASRSFTPRPRHALRRALALLPTLISLPRYALSRICHRIRQGKTGSHLSADPARR